MKGPSFVGVIECIVCRHRFTPVPDEDVLEKMEICCPNCDIKITLEFRNTTTGPVVVGFIPNSVVNEHIAKMKNNDWKRDRGLI